MWEEDEATRRRRGIIIASSCSSGTRWIWIARGQRMVRVRDGRTFARNEDGMAFIETSVLDAIGVEVAFQKLRQGPT